MRLFFGPPIKLIGSSERRKRGKRIHPTNRPRPTPSFDKLFPGSALTGYEGDGRATDLPEQFPLPIVNSAEKKSYAYSLTESERNHLGNSPPPTIHSSLFSVQYFSDSFMNFFAMADEDQKTFVALPSAGKLSLLPPPAQHRLPLSQALSALYLACQTQVFIHIASDWRRPRPGTTLLLRFFPSALLPLLL